MSSTSHWGEQLHRSARLEEQNIGLKRQLGHFVEEFKIQDKLISDVIKMLSDGIHKNLYETPQEKLIKDVYMKLGGHKAKAIEAFALATSLSGMVRTSWVDGELKFENISEEEKNNGRAKSKSC